LLGRPPARVSASDAPALARSLLERGPGAVILKLGDRGCFYCDRKVELLSGAFEVTARDATAAGDVFNAALAIAMAEGRDLAGSLRFANAAAAISVTRPGAQASVPTRAEVEAFLATAAPASPHARTRS